MPGGLRSWLCRPQQWLATEAKTKETKIKQKQCQCKTRYPALPSIP
jgi:hypothetical protein